MCGFDCMAFGSAAFDLLMSVEVLPGSNQRVKALKAMAGGGGPAATASVALASLGASTQLVTAVGDDLIGKLVLDELAERGVDVSHAQRISGVNSTSAAVLIEPSGDRSMAVYDGCINAINLDALALDRLADARSILMDGNNTALVLRVAAAARNAGVPVLLDGGNMQASMLPEILSLIDIYIPDIDTTRRQLGIEASPAECARRFAEMGPTCVCITMGDQGSLAFENGELVTMPAVAGTPILDTTGAGDNFHGAFQFARLQGWSLPRTLSFANAFAALTCRGVGGRSAIPSLQETLSLAERLVW